MFSLSFVTIDIPFTRLRTIECQQGLVGGRALTNRKGEVKAPAGSVEAFKDNPTLAFPHRDSVQFSLILHTVTRTPSLRICDYRETQDQALSQVHYKYLRLPAPVHLLLQLGSRFATTLLIEYRAVSVLFQGCTSEYYSNQTAFRSVSLLRSTTDSSKSSCRLIGCLYRRLAQISHYWHQLQHPSLFSFFQRCTPDSYFRMLYQISPHLGQSLAAAPDVTGNPDDAVPKLPWKTYTVTRLIQR